MFHYVQQQSCNNYTLHWNNDIFRCEMIVFLETKIYKIYRIWPNRTVVVHPSKYIPQYNDLELYILIKANKYHISEIYSYIEIYSFIGRNCVSFIQMCLLCHPSALMYLRHLMLNGTIFCVFIHWYIVLDWRLQQAIGKKNPFTPTHSICYTPWTSSV